ncbi:NUDIX domain-containing protein [Streptomyces sp. NPDC051079]|uniref:NUDIX hydrolase n=1 Tax=unclassified Streptomyces TaxID=2593676 RepID=UPI00344E30D7
MQTELRVAAYAVCVRDGEILLARWVDRAGVKRWTLPGGGMDHGELPVEAVVREVEEETGYVAEATALLGIDSIRRDRRGRLGGPLDWQGLRIVYEARVTGGELRNEEDGSTDLAAWHPLEAVDSLARVELVDIGLQLWRDRPPLGHSPLHDPANG